MELYRYVMDYENILDDLEEVFKKMKKAIGAEAS